jgi:hypothetical protein
MADMWGEIGTTAGKVYMDLSKRKGTTDVTDVKKALNADERVVMMAIGWLARENKLVVGREKNALTVKLKG